jgi:hypothetical protein
MLIPNLLRKSLHTDSFTFITFHSSLANHGRDRYRGQWRDFDILSNGGSNLKRFDGVSMTEYGLIGATVVVVGLSGLLSLGSNLSLTVTNFQKSLVSSKPGNKPAVQAALTKDLSTATNQLTLPPQSSALLAIQNEANSTTSTPITMNQTLETLQVSGANGATTQLASTLQTDARNMLAAGEITEAQANLLLNMANQGHELAQAQALFENAVQTGQKTVAFEGKTYGLAEFAKMISFNKSTSSAENWAIDPADASVLLKPFAEAYEDVKNSSLFSNSDTKQEVQDIALQIGALTDAFAWSADDLFGKKATVSGNLSTAFAQAITEHFEDNMEGAPLSDNASVSKKPKKVSDVVNQNSAEICEVGNGKDNGKKCSD